MDKWTNCVRHKCKVILPHERYTDGADCDPTFAWRYVTGDLSGTTLVPVLSCPVCGENVWRERDA